MTRNVPQRHVDGRVLTGSDHTFVRITTDGGLVGWGEITLPGATYIEAFGEGVRAGLVFCALNSSACALFSGAWWPNKPGAR